MLRLRMLLLALVLWSPSTSVATAGQRQTPSCQQQLATATVPSEGYAEITASDFQERVFLYVPEVSAGGAAGFLPFQLWVVEGVYGRPFARPSGSFKAAAFTRLRQSRNLRTTSISISRGNGSDWGSFGFGRASYQVQVVEVTVGRAPRVEVRVCR